MKFALHFVFLALCAVPALLAFRFGVVKRKSSNFFCFGMNPILLPILHPLLVIAVSKLFIWIAFVSAFDAGADRMEAVQKCFKGLQNPSGSVTRRSNGELLEGKLAWSNGAVTVSVKKKSDVIVPEGDIVRMRVEGDYTILYWVFRLLFSMVIPVSILILMKDLYNPKSVGTAFGCAAVSFLLWSFTIQL